MERPNAWASGILLKAHRKTVQISIPFPVEESDLLVGNTRTNMVSRKLKPKIGEETVRKPLATQMSSSPQTQVNSVLPHRGRCGAPSAGGLWGGVVVREQKYAPSFKNSKWVH